MNNNNSLKSKRNRLIQKTKMRYKKKKYRKIINPFKNMFTFTDGHC